jgi:sugar transferase (PEP-CTERM/EpsH1 system associated)
VERYITVSKDLEDYLIRRVGISASRISQIYNGVDTERFSPTQTKPAGLLPPNFLGNSHVVIGTVGRIQPVKDQATLIRAFAELLRTSPDIAQQARLAIVGDGPLLGALRDLVRSLGLSDLTWLPGARTDIPDVLRTFDVFVLPSLAEGISNTILEAMSSGVPVVATAVGGNIELVQDGRWGRLFKVGDVTTLAQILGEYVVNPSLRAAHANTARQVAVERFGLGAMTENYQALYEALCWRAQV